MSGHCKSIPDLVADLTDLGVDVRAHRDAMCQGQMSGVAEPERAELGKLLGAAEDAVLQASVFLHKATGILLNASARWLAKEQQGQDPSQEEVPH